MKLAPEDSTLYVGVYGYDEVTEFELYITCEGFNMTCEELDKTSFADSTYIDLDSSGGFRIDNSVPEGENLCP